MIEVGVALWAHEAQWALAVTVLVVAAALAAILIPTIGILIALAARHDQKRKQEAFDWSLRQVICKKAGDLRFLLDTLPESSNAQVAASVEELGCIVDDLAETKTQSLNSRATDTVCLQIVVDLLRGIRDDLRRRRIEEPFVRVVLRPEEVDALRRAYNELARCGMRPCGGSSGPTLPALGKTEEAGRDRA